MKKQLQTIIETVRFLAPDGYLYLDGALKVQSSPHSPAIYIWAIGVDNDQVQYMTGGIELPFVNKHNQWSVLEESDPNYAIIICSLQQRLGSILNTKYKTA